MLREIRVYWLACLYFMEQGFFDWDGALKFARWIVDEGWQK